MSQPGADHNHNDARLHQIDWANWQPRMRATLVFIMQDGRLLLIRKKRGLGAGKINAPGGRIDPGETPQQCAIREVQEELRITPLAVEERGTLSFQFVDGLSLHVRVFTATAWEGQPQETEEATPLWTPVDRIPYEEMWADDRLWLPEMLAGKRFDGRFLFEQDRLLAHELEVY
ncbi:MAG: 8-oxo-dGTP diphosphatase [candidate division KSB1 bacterium]|nr:8-oxo-dGTP diphosphatase [candidate division KSB1 bacterium]MDZ7276185.1 8-oxo-dGTP diphosphatase [candidate division KSB1 bacterium]MDZ7287035.1 8-oxo-dGTP diphosphatase [candidate division KSB1 bacterium]MDZ7297040.1 8-oxo-dGTP diphosphatase [candidate division KSB1 bacterium]MDZ7307199.1 8-oxo-dGTP diphosphatase [candidate division KSB1 bacterium]